MYETLHQYFIRYKRLAMPGIGFFLLEKKSAVGDFVNKQIAAPSYAITMEAVTHNPSANFFKWLGNVLHITDRDAVIRFNDFVFDLKKELLSGSTVDWDGVGILSKGLAGEIKFVPSTSFVVPEPVVAEKVIREKAEHSVRVGEEQRTSAEMTAMLTKPAEKRSFWRAYALAIGIPAFVFIAWYFYAHGVDVSSAANNKKLVPMESTAPYQLP